MTSTPVPRPRPSPCAASTFRCPPSLRSWPREGARWSLAGPGRSRPGGTRRTARPRSTSSGTRPFHGKLDGETLFHGKLDGETPGVGSFGPVGESGPPDDYAAERFRSMCERYRIDLPLARSESALAHQAGGYRTVPPGPPAALARAGAKTAGRRGRKG